MNYGEQRFQEFKRDLTPEEKAKQTLAIQAIKEQAKYEREKRQKLAKKVKEGVSLFTKFVIVTLLAVILAVLVSCDKPEMEKVEECITHDLGRAGETYTPIQIGQGGDGSGLPGVIYIHNGRVLQEICTYE